MAFGKAQAHDDAAAGDATSVLKAITLTWWLPLVRGLLLVLLGLLLMIEPLVTDVPRLVVGFAVFLLLDAAMAALQGLAARGQKAKPWWFVQAVTDVAIAALVVLWPSPTALVLYYLIAAWAAVLGVTQVITGSALLRSRDLLWPWAVASGLVGVLFGMLLVARPQDGETALRFDILALGLFAFVAGAIGTVAAFAVRATAREIDAALAGSSPVLEAIRARQAAHDAERREAAQEAAANKAQKQAERQADKDAQAARKAAEKDARAAEKAAEKDAQAAQKAAAKDARAAEKAAQKEPGAAVDPAPATAAPAAPAAQAAPEAHATPAASHEAEAAQERGRDQGVADEGDDVEHGVRDDERHDPPSSEA